ncbi:hypothetical protein CDL12_15874 [Handroanthus impetiginosus]|uniref:Ty3 transposon capsid-like protein domain-containing protein n=1 Tax=Handroanthus impetiginosus TaxID=429701 RepID=A0A2G9H1X7_9LAMI|nr:hypothetical protein CDL12_15874 [Handroanthus impetiginosus]
MEIGSSQSKKDMAQSSDYKNSDWMKTLNKVAEQRDLITKKIKEHEEVLYFMMQKLKKLGENLPQKVELDTKQFEEHGEKVTDSSHSKMRIPVLDFPRFNGENPKMWIVKCHGIFMVNPMEDWEKIQMAKCHMDGEARQWYLSSVLEKGSIKWTTFINLLMERFDASANFEGYIDNLHQEGPLDEYIRQFEELKVLLIFTHSEEYFINKFIKGLQAEIRHMVDMLAPSTLAQAIRIARKQEKLLNAMMRAQLGQNQLSNIFRKWIREVRFLKPNQFEIFDPKKYFIVMIYSIICRIG